MFLKCLEQKNLWLGSYKETDVALLQHIQKSNDSIQIETILLPSTYVLILNVPRIIMSRNVKKNVKEPFLDSMKIYYYVICLIVAVI